MRRWMKLLVLVAGFASGVSTNASAASAPAAAETPVYAILSLIGDRLDIVISQGQTGTRLDRNEHQPLPIADPVFDDAAVAAGADAIRLVTPNAEIAALHTRSQVLFDKQRTLFEVSGDTMAMPIAIKDALREQGATKLVLIGKSRDDASFGFVEGYYEGTGKIEGLGFYLDGIRRTHSVDLKTGARSEGGIGFIAPFAFMEVTLVDFPSCRVLGRKKVSAYFMAVSGRAEHDIGQPWKALTSAEKIRLINQLVTREVAATVKDLVTATGAVKLGR